MDQLVIDGTVGVLSHADNGRCAQHTPIDAALDEETGNADAAAWVGRTPGPARVA